MNHSLTKFAPFDCVRLWSIIFITMVAATWSVCAQETGDGHQVIIAPDRFQPLTEPPCSYCSTQHRKGFVNNDDRVVAWLRGAHNGGAAPLKFFLSGPRVLNDTYGLFFYDPDGGYVAVYKKDYGYSFHGWRHGVMTVKSRDGSIWSALSGKCLDGPQMGKRLNRVPSMVSDWGYWLMLHPESTAYDLFDGQTYKSVSLPKNISSEATKTMGTVDERLKPLTPVIGIEHSDESLAWQLPTDTERACINDVVGEVPVTAFWYKPTQTAVGFERSVNGQTLTFYADDISPETAPIKDRETGTRWTLAGRAVDGPLRGSELKWVDSIQCRWYAWVSEYSDCRVLQPLIDTDER